MLNTLWRNYPELRVCEGDLLAAVDALTGTFARGGKLLLCGNGGSASDCEHIVGELMKGFLSPRAVDDPRLPPGLARHLQGALPAISLTGGGALPTAFANDVDPEYVFAQQLYGLARPGDALLALSTSGNARNVCRAAELARALGLTVLGMTGETGGALTPLCDICLRAPVHETYRVQEYHLPLYHALCAEVERRMFGG